MIICAESHVTDSLSVGTDFGMRSEAQPEDW